LTTNPVDPVNPVCSFFDRIYRINGISRKNNSQEKPVLKILLIPSNEIIVGIIHKTHLAEFTNW